MYSLARKSLFALVAALALSAGSSSASAEPASKVDRDFGKDGSAKINLARDVRALDARRILGGALYPQRDSSLIVVAYPNYRGDYTVTWLTPAGKPKPGFGRRGTIRVRVTVRSYLTDEIRDALVTDGKLVLTILRDRGHTVAETEESGAEEEADGHVYLMRVTGAGSLDRRFNKRALADMPKTFPLSNWNLIHSEHPIRTIPLDNKGSTLTVNRGEETGSFATSPSGLPSKTFSTHRVDALDAGGSGTEFGMPDVVGTDRAGRVYVECERAVRVANEDHPIGCVYRLTARGLLDKRYGNGGVARPACAKQFSLLRGIRLMPDGSLTAICRSWDPQARGYPYISDYELVTLGSNGTAVGQARTFLTTVNPGNEPFDIPGIYFLDGDKTLLRIYSIGRASGTYSGHIRSFPLAVPAEYAAISFPLQRKLRPFAAASNSGFGGTPRVWVGGIDQQRNSLTVRGFGVEG